MGDEDDQSRISKAIFLDLPGGREFADWFGRVPSFHDAEIVDLHLRRSAPSIIRIHTWHVTPSFETDKHAVVTFAFDEVVDIELEGFNRQNVISGLVLRRGTRRPERKQHYVSRSNDYELELEPSYDLCGFIRARHISIGFSSGKPKNAEI
jgi:hypothetical protein